MKTIEMPWKGHNARVLAEREAMRNRLPPGVAPRPTPPGAKKPRQEAEGRPAAGSMELRVLEYLEQLSRDREALPPDYIIAIMLSVEPAEIYDALIQLSRVGHIDLQNITADRKVRVVWLSDAGRKLVSANVPDELIRRGKL